MKIIRNEAFSITELIVVTAATAFAVAALVPAAQKGRDNADEILCSSNVRELLVCSSLYLQDNDNYFPGINTGNDGRYNTTDDSYWDDKLYAYTNNYDTFKCPSSAAAFKKSVESIESDSRGVEKWKHPQSYKFNVWMEGWSPYGNNWPTSHASTIEPQPLSVGEIKYTENLIMFADRSGTHGDNSGLRHFSYFYNYGIRFMPDLVPAHDIEYMPDGEILPFYQIPECSGGITLGFYDGSCKRIERFDYTAETLQERTPPHEGLRIDPIGDDIQ
jgi:type II secretory pathway pseudopilin PulG